LTSNELVLTFGGLHVCVQFGENRRRNATVRVSTDRQTHTTHAQTQNDFIICSMLYAIAMGQIIIILNNKTLIIIIIVINMKGYSCRRQQRQKPSYTCSRSNFMLYCYGHDYFSVPEFHWHRGFKCACTNTAIKLQISQLAQLTQYTD